MNHFVKYTFFGLLLAVSLLLSSCQQAGIDSAGSEYMPDMGHSIAYEANYYDYYYFNTWGSEEGYYHMAQPRKPVAGTIPRGYAGMQSAMDTKAYKAAMHQLDGNASVNAIKVPLNGAVPYYYADTEEERTRASNEIINNPFPITEDGLAKGKELYDLYCTVCHGAKGDGNGIIYENGAYPAAPANFLQDTFYNSTNGRYYHALIYGKNVMGGYGDKLSYEERWQVIHYIHALQAKELKKNYNADSNTLNSVDVPGASMKQVAEVVEDHSDTTESHDGEGEHAPADEGGHSDGGGDGDGHH